MSCIRRMGAVFHHDFFPSWKGMSADIYQARSFYSAGVKTASLVRDGVFKAVFGDPNNPQKLISFLEAVQPKEEASKIVKIEFQDPYFPAYSPGEKDIFVDLICKTWDDKGKGPQIHVVEMQRAEQEGYVKRWDFYASRCYTNELLKAKTYDQLLKVHVTALMTHPSKYPSDYYRLVGQKSGQLIEESRVLSLLSLHEINPGISEEDSMLKKWCHLIKFSGTASLNSEILCKDPILAQAIDDLIEIKKQGKDLTTRTRTSRGMPWQLIQHQVKQKISDPKK